MVTVKRLCVRKLPPVLAIQLKRFEYDYERVCAIKFNDYFEFPRELDMEPYTGKILFKLIQKKLSPGRICRNFRDYSSRDNFFPRHFFGCAFFKWQKIVPELSLVADNSFFFVSGQFEDNYSMDNFFFENVFDSMCGSDYGQFFLKKVWFLNNFLPELKNCPRNYCTNFRNFLWKIFSPTFLSLFYL